jgi:site-specific recombinase XerD
MGRGETVNKPARTNINNHPIVSSLPDFFEEDRWPIQELGLEPDYAHSAYYLNFTKLQQPWLKHAVKRFVYLQAASKSFSSCRSYVIGLAHFSRFLQGYSTVKAAKDITREVTLDYIGYLLRQKVSVTTRKIALIHFRTFHEICVQEKWLPLPTTPLVHQADLPYRVNHTPKYIPEMVVEQLEKHLEKMPEYRQRLLTLLLETGRRISEICALPFDCLSRDKQGDPFLKINEKKLKKSYLIPISKDAYSLVKVQQEFSKTINKKTLFLFPSIVKCKSPYVTARHINESLNKLAIDNNIVDENGKLWHFHSHQFRHTVGTRMINSGVPQAIVQQFLGHETAEMTARYAHIHQETLKCEFQKFNQKLIDIKGQVYKLDTDNDAQWLKRNIMAQTLPNGLCALPATQQACPHANACLSCAHFRTNKKFIQQHKQQLEKTKVLIKEADQNGWQRQLEMNQTIEQKLTKIVNTLENDDE